MSAAALTYDAVELWVGNAKQAAHFYRSALGFALTAYAGPETGVRDRASYVLEQHELRLVLTSGLSPDSPVVAHHARHGDGVRDVAFQVDDVDAAFERALAGGAKPLEAPVTERDEHGELRLASFCAYGDTVHSLVDRSAYRGPFRPGFEAAGPDALAARWPDPGLKRIDHVVGNVPLGEMEVWSDFYERALGFSQFHHFSDEDISTDRTALMSNVLWDGVGHVKLPINEPAEGLKRSQIDEFLEAYGGPGVQHLALETDDIITAVRRLRERGVAFLETPPEYYDEARERVGEVDESWDELAAQGVLVDRDGDGYLLQTFTEPLADRPTMFFEIIQREGATGFGAGNFKALFEAVERAQARRGNL